MRRPRDRTALNERREKVSNLVWGLMFIGLGVLLAQQHAGILDPLGEGTPEGGEMLTEHAPERIADGDPETRWSSRFDDDQWVRIDLGASVEIDRVRLAWESAHARIYEVRLSDDGETWRTVVREEDGEDGTVEHAIGATGRYLQVAGIRRATAYGFSLWEVEAFGPPGAVAEDMTGPLLSKGRPVTASSQERVLFAESGQLPFLVVFWFRWWPLFVIAAGLPPLLVPHGDGEELVSLLTVAVGVLFLLNNLDWTWREAAPLVLVVAGSAVLTQGLLRGGREEKPNAEDTIGRR